jgi:hypothetical protein
VKWRAAVMAIQMAVNKRALFYRKGRAAKTFNEKAETAMSGIRRGAPPCGFRATAGPFRRAAGRCVWLPARIR